VDTQLVVWDSSGTKRLERNGIFPRLTIAGGASVEPPSELSDAIRRAWGMDTVLVRVTQEATAEVEYRGGPLPAGFRWHPAMTTPAPELRAAWHRPGWLSAVMAEVDAALSRLGRSRTGPPRQQRHTTITGIMEIPTPRGPVWLKTLLPIFAHEPRVIRCAGTFADVILPSVIVEGDGWWLSEPFPRETSRPADHFLTAMAEIQIASALHVDELRARGCPNRPLRSLPADVAELSQRRDLVTPGQGEGLGAVLPRLMDLCHAVDDLGLPDTLVHGDLNPENVRPTRNGWMLFDWTDACVGNPVVDVALAVDKEPDDRRAEAISAYAARWSRVLPADRVEHAVRAAPAIGAAHQAVSYRWILDAVDRSAADSSNGNQMLGLLRYWVDRLTNTLGSTSSPIG